MATKSSNRPGVCRCCLAEGNYKDLKSVFYWMGEKEIYYKMLEYCFDITLSNQEDTRGRYSAICELCISRLRDCVEFKKQVLTAEESFTKALDDTFGEGSSGTKFELAIKDEHIKKEMAIEPYGSDEERGMDAADDFSGFDDDLPYEPSEKKAKMSLKVEDGSDGEEVTLATLLKRKSQPMNVPKSDAKNETVKKTKAKKTTVSAKKLIASTKKTTASAKNTTAAIDNAAADETESTNTEAVVYTPKEKVAAGPVNRESQKEGKWTTKIRSNRLLLIENSTIYPFQWSIRKYFNCFYCNESFLHPALLKTHVSIHGKDEIKKKILNSFTHLNSMLKIDVSDIRCNRCHGAMPNLVALREHLTVVHGITWYENGDLTIPYVLSSDNNSCALCSSYFDNFATLNLHMNKHFNHFVCETCGRGFRNKRSLTTHRVFHETGAHPCENCGKTYKNKLTLKRHMLMVHSDELMYTCPQCPMRFKNTYFKNLHLEEVHRIKRIKPSCNYCGKTYLSSSHLQKHVRRIHLKEKKHICEVCNDAFFSKSDLANHAIKHSGEKAFVCTICSKAYARRKSLKDHMCFHNNDRRYVCSECGQSFIKKFGLKTHIKSRHAKYLP